MPSKIHHALVLNLHQPSGNLEFLFFHHQQVLKEILWAIDRIPRSLWDQYEAIGRVHLSLSGTLLETLEDRWFQTRVYGIVKCEDLLYYHLQNTKIFDIFGTAYYHPILPLIPKEDWESHLIDWHRIGKRLFGPRLFSGFWPPEMGFSMELIPLIKKMGYNYVLIDSELIKPNGMKWHDIRYRPHYARYGNDEIIVIVRDSQLSIDLKNGMNVNDFIRVANERTYYCDYEPLVTTCFDGDHGEYFRNTNDKTNFWNFCYRPFLDKVLSNSCNIRPIFIHEYLNKFTPYGEVEIITGAWNSNANNDYGLSPWSHSRAQKAAIAQIKDVSGICHALRKNLIDSGNKTLLDQLNTVYWKLLRAETSDNLYWGDKGIEICYRDLDEVEKTCTDIAIKLPS